MAKAANVFRKATVELLMIQLAGVERTVGVVLKCYRDYESAGKPSKTQSVVAQAARTQQSVVSGLENGKKVPSDATLSAIMREIGLDPCAPAPAALYKLLQYIRDERAHLRMLIKHFP